MLKQHQMPVLGSQEAGSDIESQPAGFGSCLSHKLAVRTSSTSYSTSESLSFCLYITGIMTISTDEVVRKIKDIHIHKLSEWSVAGISTD